MQLPQIKALSNVVASFALFSLFVASAILVRTRDWYTSGSDFGYNLGLAGGILMLLLLVYPLKKRVRALQHWGPTKPWFIFHMFCGIFGPLLVLYHSTFRIGSQNAMVAMVSMLLVAGSGVVGRYIYVRIHHGLSGQALKLDELEGDEESEALNINRDMRWAPDVVSELMAFRAAARDAGGTRLGAVKRFLSMPVREWRVRRSCHRRLAAYLDQRAVDRHWDGAKRRLRGTQFDALVARYIATVKLSVQLETYKRIFSWWHVVHIPFLYLLAASAVYHVIAVHMY